MERPQDEEYNSYYKLYTSQVPEGCIFEILSAELEKALELFKPLDDSAAEYRYAPKKWSLKEVLGHVIDTERVFGYRALCMARADPAPLPGMDQDLYGQNSNAHLRPLRDLLTEFDLVRRSNIALFRSFEEATTVRRGIASGFEFSVRCFAWIIAGHEIHHRKVITKRYLGR
jgi:hypothetical protein